MGGLGKYLPITYRTMFIGTLAIAGIFPFAGFFSKDEILFRAFQSNRVIWVLAVSAALMTAFYMFRLMAMTFLGAYRGPAWDHHAGHASSVAADASPRDVRIAATHGAPHPADPHAHGHAAQPKHEVAHGPAEPHGPDDAQGSADVHGGHGHGPWHGPHESPVPMTFPLMALALGAILAGFVGVPAALGGGNAIEGFLEPSFTASESHAAPGISPAADGRVNAGAASESPEHETEHASRGVELGLMAISLFIALLGIWLAHRFYVVSPDTSEALATRFAGAHRILSNKYYVDELYNSTFVAGTFASGRGLWTFDRRVVDGVVNGSGWVTVISAWFSGLTDRAVVDGLVNFVGRLCEEGSFWLRKVQTGLVQNYALLTVFGLFAFLTVYLFVR
jgi:NADH-quinone oxidoreductase subunit L